MIHRVDPATFGSMDKALSPPPQSTLKRALRPAHRSYCLQSGQYFTASFPLHIMDVQQSAMEAHSHEFYEMVYVRRGRGEHFIAGHSYPIQAGDLYVIHPGEEHCYAPAAGSSLRIVNVLWMPSLVEDILAETTRRQSTLDSAFGHESLFYIQPLLRSDASLHSGQRFDTPLKVRRSATSLGRHKASQFKPSRFAHRLHLAGRTAYRVEMLLDEMRREQNIGAPGSQVLLRHLFCALLVLLSRAYQSQHRVRGEDSHMRGALDGAQSTLGGSASGDLAGNDAAQQAIVAGAIEWIEENFTRPIRVSDVASHAALSESRLAHLFKAHTGRGVIEYLHEYRIGRVCAGLCETEHAIAAIANEAGFNDLRFFHRIFQRHTGCNPTQYRRHFGQRDG